MINFGTSNGILTINLKALANNYRLFQSMVDDGCLVAGVVKANAYGLGIEPVARILQTLNCPQFFVATLEEAIELRGLNKKTPVAVLGGFMKGAEKEYAAHNIQPILNSPDDIERWNALGKTENKTLPAILHIDTGMNRLGLSRDEAHSFVENIADYPAIDVQVIMSHFACADEKDHPLTDKQIKAFDEIAKLFPKAKKSLVNSSGLFRHSAKHYDMVRPGYALYGGNPTPEAKNPMHNVVSLKVPILQVRQCKKGESIGYGASYVFDKDTRTATIAAGYADDFLRILSGKGVVYYKNQPCPVLGRVSMDLTTIDLSHIKGDMPQQGDAIEILGENQTVDDIADDAQTIGYEILTSLGRRYKRQYIED